MNSNQKHQENQETSNTLVSKINEEIRKYKVRKLLAQDEYADVCRFRDKQALYSELRSGAAKKLKDILEEIELCNGQIRAYQENDNKAKLIPDRLL